MNYSKEWRKITILTSLLIYCMTTGANAQSFVNGSLENWGAVNTCEINTAPDGWVNYSNGCSALDEAKFPLCPSTIPPNASDGSVYGRACCGLNQGEGIAQTVSGLIPGQPYTLSFDYAGSNLYGGDDSVQWNVFVDDVNLFQAPAVSSATSNWSNYAAIFVPTSTVHTFAFRAYSVPPIFTGGSAAIDNIRLTFSGEQTGLNDPTNAAGIQVYPTLMDQNLFIKTAGNEILELLLFDLHSVRQIKEKIIGSTDLDVAYLPKGVYFLVILNNGSAVLKQTVIKK